MVKKCSVKQQAVSSDEDEIHSVIASNTFGRARPCNSPFGGSLNALELDAVKDSEDSKKKPPSTKQKVQPDWNASEWQAPAIVQHHHTHVQHCHTHWHEAGDGEEWLEDDDEGWYQSQHGWCEGQEDEDGWQGGPWNEASEWQPDGDQ